MHDWPCFNTLPRGFAWLRRELSARRESATELVETTVRFGGGATICRIGRLFEQEGASDVRLRKVAPALPSSSTLIPLSPTKPKRDPADRRWGVVVDDHD